MEKISVILPCLNEENNLKSVIEEIRTNKKFDIEIVVIDNGSRDNSVKIAKELNCKIYYEPNKGYGNALRLGNKKATNDLVVMADADSTYDLSKLESFIEPLREGYDLVIGNRFYNNIEKNAMNLLHRVGNRLLSKLTRKIYNIPVSDYHCGLRSFKRNKICSLDFKSSGMEYATEMIVLASKNNLKIKEIPATLRKSKELRKSHLRPIRDGMRHLNIIIKYKLCKEKVK